MVLPEAVGLLKVYPDSDCPVDNPALVRDMARVSRSGCQNIPLDRWTRCAVHTGQLTAAKRLLARFF